MKIVYIDTLELTHISIKEIFKGNKISMFRKLKDFVNKFDVATVKQRRVIIIDMPFNIDENIEFVKKLILFRSLSEGNLKIILFSDFTKIRFGFNRILLSPDMTLDKKTNLEEFHAEIKNIFKSKERQSHQDSPAFPGYPILTHCEYRYIMDFMREKTVKEISKINKKGIKAIYTHRRNILVKYNFKNATELHAALTYE